MTVSCGLAVTFALTGFTADARAENGWAADYVGQCCYTDLEEGQLSPPQWFEAKNIGSKTWSGGGSVVAHLGTAGPHDRHSPFFNVGEWISANRVAAIDRTVPVGGTGRFPFRVRAPNDDGTYHERFAPVADGPGGGWMDGQSQWSNVFLVYKVKATQAPTLTQVSVSPRVVDSESTVAVAVQAADNVAVDRVTMRVGGSQSVAVAPYDPPYDGATRFAAVGNLSVAGLRAGAHTVNVTAVDKLGQTDVASTEIFVRQRDEQGTAAGAPGEGKRGRRGLGKYIAWFKYQARSVRAPRIVRRIALAPAPRGSVGTVFCRRDCGLRPRSRRSRAGKVVFRRSMLRGGFLVRRRAAIETRLTRGRIGRFKLYDGRLNLRRSGCLAKKGKRFRRVRCGR